MEMSLKMLQIRYLNSKVTNLSLNFHYSTVLLETFIVLLSLPSLSFKLLMKLLKFHNMEYVGNL
jgi:hypothetical protein